MFSFNFRLFVITGAVLIQYCYADEPFTSIITATGQEAYLNAASQSSSTIIGGSNASFSESSFSASESMNSESSTDIISTGNGIVIQDSDNFESSQSISGSSSNLSISGGGISQNKESFSSTSSTTSDSDTNIISTPGGSIISSSDSFSTSETTTMESSSSGLLNSSNSLLSGNSPFPGSGLPSGSSTRSIDISDVDSLLNTPLNKPLGSSPLSPLSPGSSTKLPGVNSPLGSSPLSPLSPGSPTKLPGVNSPLGSSPLSPLSPGSPTKLPGVNSPLGSSPLSPLSPGSPTKLPGVNSPLGSSPLSPLSPGSPTKLPGVNSPLGSGPLSPLSPGSPMKLPGVNSPLGSSPLSPLSPGSPMKIPGVNSPLGPADYDSPTENLIESILDKNNDNFVSPEEILEANTPSLSSPGSISGLPGSPKPFYPKPSNGSPKLPGSPNGPFPSYPHPKHGPFSPNHPSSTIPGTPSSLYPGSGPQPYPGYPSPYPYSKIPSKPLPHPGSNLPNPLFPKPYPSSSSTSSESDFISESFSSQNGIPSSLYPSPLGVGPKGMSTSSMMESGISKSPLSPLSPSLSNLPGSPLSSSPLKPSGLSPSSPFENSGLSPLYPSPLGPRSLSPSSLSPLSPLSQSGPYPSSSSPLSPSSMGPRGVSPSSPSGLYPPSSSPLSPSSLSPLSPLSPSGLYPSSPFSPSSMGPRGLSPSSLSPLSPLSPSDLYPSSPSLFSPLGPSGLTPSPLSPSGLSPSPLSPLYPPGHSPSIPFHPKPSGGSPSSPLYPPGYSPSIPFHPKPSGGSPLSPLSPLYPSGHSPSTPFYPRPSGVSPLSPLSPLYPLGPSGFPSPLSPSPLGPDYLPYGLTPEGYFYDQIFDSLRLQYEMSRMDYINGMSVYPPDISDTIDQMIDSLIVDYVFLGSGPGSLAALKTLLDTGKQVLLIERGYLPPYQALSLSQRPSLLDTGYVRNVQATAPYVDIPKNIHLPNVLGEETTYNNNIWDYGYRRKFDLWGKFSPRWSWNQIVNYFTGRDEYSLETCAITYTDRLPETKAIDIVTRLFQDMGIYPTEYIQGSHPEGLQVMPRLEENGENVIYAQEIFEIFVGYSNLQLALRTIPKNIIFDVNGRAIGVNVITPYGNERTITVQDEVIIGSNAIDAVSLLYQSGVGPYDDLVQNNIQPQINLPAVGKGLLLMPSYNGLFYTFPSGTLLNKWESDWASLEYILGSNQLPPTLALQYYKAFLKIFESSDSNVVVTFHAFSRYTKDSLRTFIKRISYMDESIEAYVLELIDNYDILFAVPTLTDIQSRGEIYIDNPYLYEPVIDTGMYESKKDMAIMLETLQVLRALAQTEIFQALNGQVVQIPFSQCGIPDYSVEYDQCSIRYLSIPNTHFIGGCLMGNNPLTSVVNEELLLHYSQNVRIFSTAVMPVGTGVGSSAVDSMIGKYGSQFVIQNNILY